MNDKVSVMNSKHFEQLSHILIIYTAFIVSLHTSRHGKFSADSPRHFSLSLLYISLPYCASLLGFLLPSLSFAFILATQEKLMLLSRGKSPSLLPSVPRGRTSSGQISSLPSTACLLFLHAVEIDLLQDRRCVLAYTGRILWVRVTKEGKKENKEKNVNSRRNASNLVRTGWPYSTCSGSLLCPLLVTWSV